MKRFLPYWALLKQQLIAQTQFRVGFWSHIVTNIFWGVARAVMIAVFYRYGEGRADALTMAQAVSICWLQQSALNLLPGFAMDYSVWNKIRSGDVACELLRPLDLYGHWYANAISGKLAPFLLAVAPVTLAGFLVRAPYALSLPASSAHLAACVITLLSGLLVSCSSILLCYAMCMDERVGDALAGVAMTAMQILAGGYLPLQLWPDAWQTFLSWQPFATMLDLPLRFYVGAAALGEVPAVLFKQLLWGVALALIGRAWIARNCKRLVLQGG